MISECDTSKKFMQTYIKGRFMISTIYRRSSVMMDPPPWFYETFVWGLNTNGEREKGYTDETCSSVTFPDQAMKHHFKVCEKYLEMIKEGEA